MRDTKLSAWWAAPGDSVLADRIEPGIVPPALVVVGILGVIATVADWMIFEGTTLLTVTFVGTTIMTGVPSLGVSYAGYRLWRGDIDLEPERYPRIGAWCLGGLVGFLGLNLVIMSLTPAVMLRGNVGWARGSAIYGAVGGLMVGLIEARAVQRALDAERAAMEAKHAEEQRQWLAYLNSLLRHEVLNNANVIVGYTDLLLDSHGHDDEIAPHLETIRRQSENMTDVIKDVRVLIEANENAAEFEPVNLSDVVTDVTTDLLDASDDALIETDVPADAYVRADDLLPRVFSNLLSNAVEHNDADRPRVQVDVEKNRETLCVLVSDNGPGVSRSEREALFEREAARDHGLGLYLTKTLVERYGGTIELSETGAEGSVFAVELPRASGTPPGESESAPIAPSDADGCIAVVASGDLTR
jgi:signal transduction histidine kinase